MYNKHDLDELQRHLLHHLESLASDPFILLNRVSVGFENIFDDARLASDQDLRFPFHNLEAVEDGYLLNFTLAGWDRSEVKVKAEENKIVITGEPVKNLNEENRESLHRGITKKAFNRTIIVRPGLEVSQAWMYNGLLSIKLVKPEPVSNMKEITIGTLVPVDPAAAAKADYLQAEKARHAAAMGEVPEGHVRLDETT